MKGAPKMKRFTALFLIVIFLALTLASCTQTEPDESDFSEIISEIISDTASARDESSQTLPELTPVPFESKTVTVDEETGLPILPTLAERANEEYVRSNPGGMDWTYEELIAMTPEDINEKLMQPAFKHYHHFTGLGDMRTEDGSGTDFWNAEQGSKWGMYRVKDEKFPTYESFVCETRKFFSPDLAAEYFGYGCYMEYGEEFYSVAGARGSSIDYCTIDFTILSSSETEIKYRGVARYYLYEEDWGTNPETSLPDDRFEFRYFDYTLTLQDGRWVFTRFSLPY